MKNAILHETPMLKLVNNVNNNIPLKSKMNSLQPWNQLTKCWLLIIEKEFMKSKNKEAEEIYLFNLMHNIY